VRRDPCTDPELGLHLLCVRVERAEERKLDLVVRDLRDDDVRVEREICQQPRKQCRIRQLDAQRSPPFVARASAQRGAPSIPRLEEGASASSRKVSPVTGRVPWVDGEGGASNLWRW
jgi:hypothetical protein